MIYLPFRCPLLRIYLQFCGWNSAPDELRQPVLAAVVGGHRLPLQKHGPLGVLLLQIPASGLPGVNFTKNSQAAFHMKVFFVAFVLLQLMFVFFE